MGIILGKKFHYDIIRPGIALYGGHNNTALKNRGKLHSKIDRANQQGHTSRVNPIGLLNLIKSSKDLNFFE